MDLTNILHSSKEELLSFTPDIFIAASGYESRSICIPEFLGKMDCRLIVLTFKEKANELARKANDKYFSEAGYEMRSTSANEAPAIEEILAEHQEDSLQILIDISVMTRTWYHHFLKFFHNYEGKTKIHLKLAYCPAYYEHPKKGARKVQLKYYSMLDDKKRQNNQKETALLLGLNYEERIGEQIFKSIKPAKTSLLYPDPAAQKEFVERIYINNHDLIQKIHIQNLIGYPLEDTEKIYSILINQILPLREKYNIIIVPQGPKIFALITMIIQISYPDIELLFPVLKKRSISDRKATENPLSLDLIFEEE